MMSENNAQKAELVRALQWHIDHGADEMLLDNPVDRTAIVEMPKPPAVTMPSVAVQESTPAKVLNFQDSAGQSDIMGAAQAIEEARKIAATCDTLEALQQAIQDFEGLSVKKTASNLVFADGNPKAKIMLIGEAPGADEDIQGKPFVGESGQLLDRILACIDLDRRSEDLDTAVYISNVLNWRPPGNRTPTNAEMDISLPFIQRHIELIDPEFIILWGGMTAKALFRSSESISKLRGKFHDYKISDRKNIPAIVTYHPAYLLRTPAQKKAVWADMLMFQDKLKNL